VIAAGGSQTKKTKNANANANVNECDCKNGRLGNGQSKRLSLANHSSWPLLMAFAAGIGGWEAITSPPSLYSAAVLSLSLESNRI
jgi:hypothetical protein